MMKLWPSTLIYRLLFVMLLLLMLLVSGTISYWQYGVLPRVLKEEQVKADQLLMATHLAIEHYVSEQKLGELQLYTDGLLLLRNPNTEAMLVHGIVIEGLDATLATSFGSGSKELSFFAEEMLFSRGENSQMIGSVQLFYSQDRFLQIKKQGEGLLIVICVMFILLLTVVWLVIQYLLSPLKDLTARISQIDTEQAYDWPVNRGRKSEEIALVEGALYKLLKLLREHRDDLEDKVADRTVALREATFEADEANQAKSMFLANMSHEIRTPLNTVVGLTKLSLLEGASPKLASNLTEIQAASQSLLVMVDDILDFSKIEAGHMTLLHAPCDLRQLFDELKTLFDGRALKKEVNLIFSMGSGVPEKLQGDTHKLKRVLSNLIGNALKFTKVGKVSVLVEVVEQGNEQVRLAFSVADTGIGIQPEKMRHLFDSFMQADVSVTREYGGTGLGLAICQQLVDMMGGKLAVESEVAVGSCFAFTIAMDHEDVLQRVEQKDDKQVETTVVKSTEDCMPEPADTLEGLRVLVVDDNDINRCMLSEILSFDGMLITEACNGEQALAVVQQQCLDIVLMDVQMPVMGGLEATKIIRQELGMLDLPIIALTANATQADKDACFAAGMNDFSSKPIDFVALHKLFVKWATVKAEAPVHVERDAMVVCDDSLAFSELERAGIDVARALKNLNGNTVLYRKLLRMFYDEQQHTLLQLQKAIGNDWAAALFITHSLKGLAGNIRATLLRKAVQDLGLALKHGKKDRVDVLCKVVGLELNRVFVAIEKMLALETSREVDHGRSWDKAKVQQDLSTLASLLQHADTAAEDALYALEEALLGNVLYRSEFKQMKVCVDQFEFDDALLLLETIRSRLHKEGSL